MFQIPRNGIDQYVPFRATEVDSEGNIVGPLTGTNDGDLLPGAIITLVEFTSPPGYTDIEAEDTEVLWKALTSGGEWLAKIPHSYISRSGQARLLISGTGMVPIAIDLTVGGIGTGGEQIISNYTLNSTAKTVQLPTEITKEMIKKITGVDSNLNIYDSEHPLQGKNISLDGETPGLFHYDYKGVPVGETLRIVVNPQYTA